MNTAQALTSLLGSPGPPVKLDVCWGCIDAELDTWHFLHGRVEYAPRLDRLWQSSERRWTRRLQEHPEKVPQQQRFIVNRAWDFPLRMRRMLRLPRTDFTGKSASMFHTYEMDSLLSQDIFAVIHVVYAHVLALVGPASPHDIGPLRVFTVKAPLDDHDQATIRCPEDHSWTPVMMEEGWYPEDDTLPRLDHLPVWDQRIKVLFSADPLLRPSSGIKFAYGEGLDPGPYVRPLTALRRPPRFDRHRLLLHHPATPFSLEEPIDALVVTKRGLHCPRCHGVLQLHSRPPGGLPTTPDARGDGGARKPSSIARGAP